MEGMTNPTNSLHRRHVASAASTPKAAATSSSAPPRRKRKSRLVACARCCTLATVVMVLACSLALVSHAVVHGRALTPKGVLAPVNFFFMKLARDMSRVKARRRRFGHEGALMATAMPVFLGQEEALPLADANDVGMHSLTSEELAEFDGRYLPDSPERAPLYLSIRGRIYDVSAAWSFYGPGKTYFGLVGRDATRAFCTGCLDEPCLISSLEGLTEAQRREADRWVELYEHHDKYSLVGALREASVLDEPPADDAAAQAAAAEPDDDEWEQEQLRAAQEAEGAKKHKPFRPPV